MARDEIGGNWYGMVVSTPHWGPIEVSFDREGARYTGAWNFPGVERGDAKAGQFQAIRFAHSLRVRITTAPLDGVQFRLGFVGSRENSMMFGEIPLDGADFPYASVTLFRKKPDDRVMDGICPIARKRKLLRRKLTKA